MSVDVRGIAPADLVGGLVDRDARDGQRFALLHDSQVECPPALVTHCDVVAPSVAVNIDFVDAVGRVVDEGFKFLSVLKAAILSRADDLSEVEVAGVKQVV